MSLQMSIYSNPFQKIRILDFFRIFIFFNLIFEFSFSSLDLKKYLKMNESSSESSGESSNEYDFDSCSSKSETHRPNDYISRKKIVKKKIQKTNSEQE
jgi:hypothetical protein